MLITCYCLMFKLQEEHASVKNTWFKKTCKIAQQSVTRKIKINVKPPQKTAHAWAEPLRKKTPQYITAYNNNNSVFIEAVKRVRTVIVWKHGGTLPALNLSCTLACRLLTLESTLLKAGSSSSTSK